MKATTRMRWEQQEEERATMMRGDIATDSIWTSTTTRTTRTLTIPPPRRCRKCRRTQCSGKWTDWKVQLQVQLRRRIACLERPPQVNRARSMHQLEVELQMQVQVRVLKSQRRKRGEIQLPRKPLPRRNQKVNQHRHRRPTLLQEHRLSLPPHGLRSSLDNQYLRI